MRAPGGTLRDLLPVLLLTTLVLTGCTGGTPDVPTAVPTVPTTSVVEPRSSTIGPTEVPATTAVTATTATTATTVAPTVSAAPGTALAVLEDLDVRERAVADGYAREEFGQRWADVDRNGCDTRNDVLARDLTGVRFRDGSRCVVASGTLADPYTGAVLPFLRGDDTSDDIQIDHVVALAGAWRTGAQSWDEATRTAFANDPLNLLAVDGAANQAKGDSDAAAWLPPAAAERCAFVARQIAVKQRYSAWVTPTERDAMATVLRTCPAQPVPTGPAPTPTRTPTPGQSVSTSAITPAPPTSGPPPSAEASDAKSSDAAPSDDAPPPAPGGCLIKGNINSEGERIYHVPGSRSYDETRIDLDRGERWFCTEDEALSAGWRAPLG